ncbi:MAG: hypothetical protein LBG97_08720 [Coriobacteriales bacterium]|jgi:pyocin large subunit-like protein|nr:hypothetical protein [Coriobacteriales bacterium]
MGGRGCAAGCDGNRLRHGFTDTQLNRKFRKHGHEFGDITKEEYGLRAIKFRDSEENSLVKKFTTKAGNTFMYNTETNEFLLHKSSGEITTYFFPTDGVGYWTRQREKYETQ